jgi:hypothetical protein
LLPGEKPYPNGVQNVNGKLMFNGHELPNAKPDTEIKPGENGSVTYKDGNREITMWPPKEGDTVPVVKYDYGNGHVEFKQGTRSIWTTDGHKWWAGSDGRDQVSVDTPWQEGLARGEIRVVDGDTDYVLGGKATPGHPDGWVS